MDVTETFDAKTRRAWRCWLAEHHRSKSEIWLLLRPVPGTLTDEGARRFLTYLDAVEEALCFGWIDGIAKRHETGASAQRFTPRRPKSAWTELNKERARRLLAAGQMTEAGRARLPDLQETALVVPEDLAERLRREPGAWEFFAAFPVLYKRVRLGYIEEMRRRNPGEWERRAAHFIAKTAKNERFGNWDDSGLPRTALDDDEG